MTRVLDSEKSSTNLRSDFPDALRRLVESAASIRWCHWKSNIRLKKSVAGETDLDILVHPDDAEVFANALSSSGFIPFHAVPWSDYPGVSNWLGADAETGLNFHVHLHNRLLTGMKSAKEQDLPWADAVLDARVLDDKTSIPIVPPALEAHILLAREITKSNRVRRAICWLWRKPAISRMNQEEMTYLLERADPEEVDDWGVRLWGESAWFAARVAFNADQWATVPALTALARVLEPILRKWRRPLLGAYQKRIKGIALKRLLRLIKRLDPTTPMRMRMMTRAPLIAFIGSDGSGKSTVTTDLRKWLSWKADCQVVYFGSKDNVYRFLQRYLGGRGKRKAGTRTYQAAGTGPARHEISVWKACRVAYAAHLRFRNMRRAEKMLARGQIVIADRFPQSEISGIFDGASGVDPAQVSGVRRLLYRYEEKVNVRIRTMKPDLLVRMVVPIDVAQKRKPDHDRAALERKIELTRTLEFGAVPSVEVDSTRPLAEVLLLTRSIVWQKAYEVAQGEP